MIHPAVLILPALVCFFWALVHAILAFRTNTFRLFFLILVFVGITALADSGTFFHQAEWGSNALQRLLLMAVGPSIVPLLILYLDHLGKDTRHYRYQLIWIAIPASLFTAALILTVLMGTDRVNVFLSRIHTEGDSFMPTLRGELEHAYFVCTDLLFKFFLILEVIIFLGFVVVHSRREQLQYKQIGPFLFHGGLVGVKELQFAFLTLIVLVATFKVILTEHFFHEHTVINAVWSFLFAAFIFIDSYLALFSAKEKVSFQEMANGFRYNYRIKNQSAILEQMMGEMVEDVNPESLLRVLESIGIHSNMGALERAKGKGKENNVPSLATSLFSAVSSFQADDSLRDRFRHLMMDEQAFLHPSLTLSDVAERLHSNKTYVSKMVNNTYNMGFPEVLNILRIDYAEQYIISHREATQEEIAKACGFLSASSLNSTFKRITGYTPKVWAARNQE